MTAVPRIPTASNPEAAFELLTEAGACVMPGIIDLDSLPTGLVWPFDGHRSNRLDESLADTISLVSDLRRVAPRYSLSNVEANVMDLPDSHSERRFRVHIHQDHRGVLEGYALLIPVVHGADLSIHSFNSNTEPPLFKGSYGPGDAFIVAQQMPQERGDSSAVWHSSVSQRLDAGGRQRRFISVDMLNENGYKNLRNDLEDRRLVRLAANTAEMPPQMLPIQ